MSYPATYAVYNLRFPPGQRNWVIKLITLFHAVLTLRMSGALPPISRLYGVLLN